MWCRKNTWADCGYLDLKNAFNKVPHRSVLEGEEFGRTGWNSFELDEELLDEKENEDSS